MGIINVLDKKTINKIAAGEVVVNGASVLKELLENSIDAGSKNITIDISNGGKDYIRVLDDGCGIMPEDIPLAFLRNSTSKIINSIDNIETLGFRGEALASISYVSKIELITKHAGYPTAKKCKIHSCEIIDEEDIAHVEGTQITVSDLFYNLPVRAKHLRDEREEAAEMISVAEDIALSRPDISFVLTNNKRRLFATPGNAEISDTLLSVYGKETSLRFMPFEYEDSPLHVKGLLVSENHINEREPIRTIFVNNRYVKMPQINKSIDSVYDELFSKKKAEFILYIDIPNNMVDVNVHPSKLSIRFYNESLITLLIRQGVRDFLKNNYVIKESFPKQNTYKTNVLNDGYDTEVKLFKETDTLYNERLSEQMRLEYVPTNNRNKQTQATKEPSLEEDDDLNKNIINRDIFNELSQANIIGNAFGLYALIEYGDELYAIDTHAAHERVLYESYLSSFNQNKLVVQDIMVPIVVELTPKMYTVAINSIDIFLQIGFDICEVSDNSIIIHAIPHYFANEDIKNIFNMLLTHINDCNPTESLKNRNESLIKIACHNAVRGNENISVEETRTLLCDLAKCDFPYACPHGRPTIGKVNKRYFMKVFERI